MIPVGYYPCTQDAPEGKNVDRMIDEIMAQAELCEQTNYDGFYFTEHHQQADGYLPNPVLMAGLVGARTTRINVGTCIALAPLYHPIRLAEDCAVIDQATKGRFRLALGIGYQDIDFEAFGVNPKQRARRSEEVIAVLRDAWAGKKVSALSSDYQFKDVSVTPTPFRKTRISGLPHGVNPVLNAPRVSPTAGLSTPFSQYLLLKHRLICTAKNVRRMAANLLFV
ncbi:MAG: hypothetical protein DRR06_11245 [Gammaproteobacteria bacterium]|nr:MAG: hypothetical protein DRR42_24735 [Gammaproteobacteria bacterium]RLA43786.1 MAG: hypothetical protein DRR06_11245 [Gammaproteobacteria bacterium]